MNLRKIGSYNIGLDIGTASVGWAVTTTEGELPHFNGQPVWGSRIFPEASPAADARSFRGQRRRYDRRRQRLDLLQGIFAQEMERTDPEFFIRLNQSRLHPEDREEGHVDYEWPLFNGAPFDEKAYYEQFPTIYHLRKWLMETDEKADIRLIYLAFHNIVKHRGNFLRQDQLSLTSKNANVDGAVKDLCFTLQDWCDAHGIDCEVSENGHAIMDALKEKNVTRSQVAANVAPLLSIQPSGILEKKAATDLAKALSKAIVGQSTEMGNVVFLFEEKPDGLTTKIYLSNDEQVDAVRDTCPADSAALFDSLCALYSAFVLQDILSHVPGGTISENKIWEYDQYKKDLKLLKSLVKQYVSKEYDSFFRGSHFPNGRYDSTKVQGYTLYDTAHKTPYDAFRKDVEKLFKGTEAHTDERYQQMMERFKEEGFLRRLKTSDNGNIPFQLHREEMDAIIQNQKRFYPFLETEQEKLDSLVIFRIPYYVGPLTQKNARRVGDDPEGETRFAWSERLPGQEQAKVYPWNWEEVIDKDASAEKFIRRMTGTCTYVHGEPVLPRCSLLYEEFCVLNELNGAHWSADGDEEHRFDAADRESLIEELFKKKRVTYKAVEEWMVQNGHPHVHVSGGQGETGFESKLSSYIFFSKDILHVDEIPLSDYPMIEDIILWNTIFEDRDILKRKIKTAYGNLLDDQQIKRICKKRFAGWGKLSEKFLTGIKAQTDLGLRSIMDVMREGNPNNTGRARTMVLMEALRDDDLRFQKLVDDLNREHLQSTSYSLEDIPGSPKLRRGINQAIRIVEEIERIAGHAPDNIFVEVTRSDDAQKGQRTNKRYDSLKEHLIKFKEDNPKFWDEQVQKDLALLGHGNLNEKLMLYFMQGGKSLYSGKPLSLDRISEYEVDHILPRSYIKDDSLENKALVLKEENQRKSDQMLLPAEMRRQMKSYWQALRSAELIGEKKFRNLMRSEVKERQLKGFINRQIVETSQIVKHVQMILEDMLPDTKVLPVKAGLSSELRKCAELPKCRQVNDFHHAHDALLACQIGRFIQTRFPDMYENPLHYQHAIRAFIKREGEHVRKGHNPFGSSFVISSFMRSGFDEETGEITEKGDEVWNALFEIARIKRYLDYRQCHVTRMPEETKGAFWDQTIYSPYDPKKKDQLKLPLKKGLDPKKYGSYSSEQYAYFFVYEVENTQGERAAVFAPLPISVAHEVNADPDALRDRAASLVGHDKFIVRKIIRGRILKQQLLELDGSRVRIIGREEVRNAVQVALDLACTSIVERILLEEAGEAVEPVDESDIIRVFKAIRSSIERYSPRLAQAIKLDERTGAFMQVGLADKKQIVLGLLAIAAGKTNKVDLTAVGGSKNSGQMKVNFSKMIDDGRVVIVDQSVTGLFERRERLGL